MQKLEKRTRFLMIGLVVVLAFCIGVFGIMTKFINDQNLQTMDSVGRLYMAAMNEQISMHFSTMIDLRLTQLDTLAETMPFARDADGVDLREWLTYNAQIRGFESLAYYYE